MSQQAVAGTPVGANWVDSIAAALPILAQAVPIMVSAKQQNQVLKTNLERQKNGLEPVDIEDYSAGFKLGIDKSTQKTLLIGGGLMLVAVGGIYYMKKGK